MKWIKLLNKIRKQPMSAIKYEDVKLKFSDGEYYFLKLVYTDNGNKFHFEIDNKVEE